MKIKVDRTNELEVAKALGKKVKFESKQWAIRPKEAPADEKMYGEYTRKIKGGEIRISASRGDLGEIIKDKYARTTLNRREVRQVIKPYIKDLLAAGLVEDGQSPKE